MSVKISSLPAVTNISSTTIVPVVQLLTGNLTTQTANGAILSSYISGSIKQSVSVTANAAGNFTVPHGLGHVPSVGLVQPTSSGSIWFQNPVSYDATYLYLTASGAATANIIVFI